MSSGRKRIQLIGRNKLENEITNKQRAVLWDMDGTIVDSAPYHKLAWQETFKNRGLDFTEDDFQFAFGRRNEEIISKLMGADKSKEEIDAVAKEKEVTFRRFIRQNVEALPGVKELIKALSEAQFQLAIVSSTPLENIQLITETLGIKEYFNLFISGEDVNEGKPSPQGYLLAARKLRVQSQNCIVIEDVVAGVKAAKRGGMICIAFTNTFPGKELAEADMIVNSLEEVDVKTITRLFNRVRSD